VQTIDVYNSELFSLRAGVYSMLLDVQRITKHVPFWSF